MQYMTDQNLLNRVCFVVRYSGNIKLQASRFKCIVNAAKNAVAQQIQSPPPAIKKLKTSSVQDTQKGLSDNQPGATQQLQSHGGQSHNIKSGYRPDANPPSRGARPMWPSRSAWRGNFNRGRRPYVNKRAGQNTRGRANPRGAVKNYAGKPYTRRGGASAGKRTNPSKTDEQPTRRRQYDGNWQDLSENETAVDQTEDDDDRASQELLEDWSKEREGAFTDNDNDSEI